VSPQAAGDYLQALATRLDVGADLGPDDRFDLVIAHRRAATGEEQSGPLLYAAVNRMGRAPLQMIKWTVAGRTGWFDAASLTQVSTSALAWPVSARITSGFGMRRHPILGFARMHTGVDWAAPRGTAIIAAGNGTVEKAGWDSGGYGNQTIVRHANGYESSYNHQSAIAKGVVPGAKIRQGQVIGWVGTTGESTGPHLHYELIVNGTKVDPLRIRLPGGKSLQGEALAKFEDERKRIDTLLNNQTPDQVASK
jgi:murein DD-endopeptidase MepM/ murein hydrolase activator NlpD